MARGWESKSVESQIEDRKAEVDKENHRTTPEDLELQSRRRSLELSIRRVRNDLETASSPVHRTALENGLKFLEDELRKLETP